MNEYPFSEVVTKITLVSKRKEPGNTFVKQCKNAIVIDKVK